MGSQRWVVVAAILGSLIIGVAAYDVGLMQGAARAAVAAGAEPPYAYWGWHGHWGGGFGFPIFFLFFFWFIFARALFWGWGGPWRRRWYYRHLDDDRPSFDEWHRRAHERMKSSDSSGTV